MGGAEPGGGAGLVQGDVGGAVARPRPRPRHRLAVLHCKYILVILLTVDLLLLTSHDEDDADCHQGEARHHGHQDHQDRGHHQARAAALTNQR